MEYKEDDFLMLSGIQHFAFCRRQWALIHIEQQWEENGRTIEGKHIHKRVHNPNYHTKRGDIISIRGLRIQSRTLGLSGECDLVEFHKNKDGIQLNKYEGAWIPVPVEYKKGTIKDNDADELQLCAQAMCLEEMFCCSIQEGYLYYDENRRRKRIIFDDTLRCKVGEYTREMHRYFSRGYTPKSKPSKSCNACSLKNVCIPQLEKKKNIESYLISALEDE